MTGDIIAIVPARGGSKGLPKKNILDLCGKPLYRHSVDAALDAGIKKVLITTDMEEIFGHEQPVGVSVVRRAPGLEGDNVPMKDVIANTIAEVPIHASTLVLLQPTSPLRRPDHIREGLQIFVSAKWKLVMSVCEAQSSVLKWGRVEAGTFMPLSDPRYCFSNRQSLPKVFRPNGALYVFDADQFRATGDFAFDSIGTVLMTESDSMDIDTQADFMNCEEILRKRIV